MTVLPLLRPPSEYGESPLGRGEATCLRELGNLARNYDFPGCHYPKKGAIFGAFMMKVCSLFTLEYESQALLCSPLIQSTDYDLLHSAHSSPISGCLERM